MQLSFSREPAAILGFVGAIIGLVIAFGVPLTKEQTGAIMAVVTAGVGLAIRSQVSPVSKLESNGIDPDALK